mgnify:CR=1 FL=1|jgi:hypothetical protein
MFGNFGKSFSFGERPGIKATVSRSNLLTVYPSTQLWYDFSSTGSTSYSPVPTTVTNGGSMTQAHDLAGNNRNTNNVSNFKYITNVSGSLGAANMGAGGYFNTNSTTSWLSNLSGMTVIVAAYQTSSGSTYYLCNTDQGDLAIYYSGGQWQVKCSGGNGNSTVNAQNNRWQLHSFVYDGSAATNAQKLRYRYNKADQVLTITGTIAAKSNASNDNYVWAAQDTSSSNAFKGYIGEVLLFNKALSSGELSGIETYLGNKWGI